MLELMLITVLSAKVRQLLAAEVSSALLMWVSTENRVWFLMWSPGLRHSQLSICSSVWDWGLAILNWFNTVPEAKPLWREVQSSFEGLLRAGYPGLCKKALCRTVSGIHLKKNIQEKMRWMWFLTVWYGMPESRKQPEHLHQLFNSSWWAFFLSKARSSL